jgi:hypothetical protein
MTAINADRTDALSNCESSLVQDWRYTREHPMNKLSSFVDARNANVMSKYLYRQFGPFEVATGDHVVNYDLIATHRYVNCEG